MSTAALLPSSRSHLHGSLVSSLIAAISVVSTTVLPAQSQPTQWMRERHLDEQTGHAMAYDFVRQRVVLFGCGLDMRNPRPGTWEWDGVRWHQRSPMNSPSARWGHKLAYDIVRQRVVLFGGTGIAGVPLGDTYEWDGSNWSL